MFYKILKTKVKSLDAAIYKQLYSLNFRKYSIMRKELVAAKEHNKAVIYYILDGKKVLAWSILLENSFNLERYYQAKSVRTSYYDVHFYVRKEYRRMGLGKKLYNLNNKICFNNNKKMYKIVHDITSKKFFKSCI